jgi:hypothetical protein
MEKLLLRCGTAGPRRSLLMETHGNYLGVYGSMGNVPLTLPQTLMGFLFVAGAGKSALWYVHH